MKSSHAGLGLVIAVLMATPLAAQDFTQSAASEKMPQTEGKALYDAICAGCHMPDGKGAVGAGHYPPLANSAFVESKEGVAQWIIQGHKAMPPLGGVMDDEQIAAIVNYLRSNLGNSYDETISAAEVAEIRSW